MSHRLPDFRSGLVLDTHELGGRGGSMKQLTRIAEAPEGIGIAMIGVPPGSPIRLDLMIEAVVEGVLVTGTAEVRLGGQCARCLEAVESSLAVDLAELYLYPEKEPDDEEASRLKDDLVDLEPLLRDAVVLELPFTPLCQPDCAGLCPTCGENLNRNPEHSHAEATDARWAGLAGWAAGETSTESAASGRVTKE